ncbi:ADC synthase [Ramicandelaber brevisporus]|nr:ADC synthase [Ramicandelaber brevisporus]
MPEQAPLLSMTTSTSTNNSNSNISSGSSNSGGGGGGGWDEQHQQISSSNLAKLRVLIIDNYDSYTLNLVNLWTTSINLTEQQLPYHKSTALNADELASHQIAVIRNDQFSWDVLRDSILPHFDCCVLSPGPGEPSNPADFGLCGPLIEEFGSQIPIFGICLGFQGIVSGLGGKIIKADRPMHGLVRRVYADTEAKLMRNVPSPFSVVRYHSLVADLETLPSELRPLAWGVDVDAVDDKVGQNESTAFRRAGEAGSRALMAVAHQSYPLVGVQFHPESVSTEFGADLMRNFLGMAYSFWTFQEPLRFKTRQDAAIPDDILAVIHSSDTITPSSANVLQLLHHSKPAVSVTIQQVHSGGKLNMSEVYERVFGPNCTASFWMDSARNNEVQNLGRFSIMGGISPSSGASIRYTVASKRLTVERIGYSSADQQQQQQQHLLDKTLGSGNSRTFWDWLDTFSALVKIDDSNVPRPLYFGYRGGLVGYIGYELRAESLPGYHHASSIPASPHGTPDAALMFVNDSLVYDHATGDLYAVCLSSNSPRSAWPAEWQWAADIIRSTASARDWIAKVTDTIESDVSSAASSKANSPSLDTPLTSALTHEDIACAAALSSAEYQTAVSRVQHFISLGETYEANMTTQCRWDISHRPIRSNQDALQLYKLFRAANPAPFAGLFHWSDTNLTICCTSPERFIKIGMNVAETKRVAEMKPIKGTAPRVYQALGKGKRVIDIEADQLVAQELQSNIKERAENLMIVDLVRHDLTAVCKPSSVIVPWLMTIESYETVHQLVSVVTGEVQPAQSNVRVLQRCFPPGSMTGAPKLRTVEILDDLESANNVSGAKLPGRRGVYSGCVGYFSLCGQAADWSVVIRTAVVEDSGTKLSVGAGGAVTILSSPKAEYDEMIEKALSLSRGLAGWLSN